MQANAWHGSYRKPRQTVPVHVEPITGQEEGDKLAKVTIV